jgi:predicted nucleic acid-binding protein
VEAELILVDTNAWVNHLRKKDPELTRFLSEEQVHTCDVVVGELLLGSGLPKTFAGDLLALPRLPSPSAVETRTFIEDRRSGFSGSGVGWADAQVILAALKSGARVYTSDRGVRKICRAIGVALA